MPVESGVEKAPGDADCGERLHHFEVARSGSAGQAQPFKVNEERNASGDRGKEKERNDRGAGVSLRRGRPQRRPISFP